MDQSDANRDPRLDDRAQRLIELGATLVSELDLEVVLRSVVEAGRDLTNSRYAALGVLDRDRTELERFIYLGIDDEERREIGDLPRGHGILGELIREPVPLRLDDVNLHPHAYGFPPAHPPMHSFLGVPIIIRGEAYGNLYMTEKQGAAGFDEGDEEAAKTLATWASIAIENARLYTSLSEHEAQIERTLRQAQTSADIARTVGGETDVTRVLDLIVKRARALVEARALLVLLEREDCLEVAAYAGHVGADVDQLAIPSDDPLFKAAMTERVAKHLEPDTPSTEARLRERLGVKSALVVPLLFRGRAVGVLVAGGREGVDSDFDQEDLRLLQAFAASAATAVATAQTVESERLQQQVEAGEKERLRWARELHDETLQGLAAIRISLATALQSRGEDRAERVVAAAEETVDRLEDQIGELSRLINDLRPTSLERLGLVGALRALVEELGIRGGFEAKAEIEIDRALSAEEERVVYRLAQEALNNVAKHAAAARATLRVQPLDGALQVEVEDDGSGFDVRHADGGRGLEGMRERVALIGGRIEVDSRPGAGTRVTAALPIGG